MVKNMGVDSETEERKAPDLWLEAIKAHRAGLGLGRPVGPSQLAPVSVSAVLR